ncbi:unnamed protein product (macronuclear) [Paramecium tetraurelia]|uniref:Uncharacterized protein n=1 Tax=Paramecium tetraurelia TaxID=5888 RepID=A0E0B4_PARTE|nr:uncharacterized protein GSPATT00021899001 [Paramecium tetraurelia]CAK88731.1 unnamed protein product [Paramecium tetraurelia]|eukprot:XP_001456128.1 hypothetical protein (macronuclear) [Paramecium tetraurelia strain d4-2]
MNLGIEQIIPSLQNSIVNHTQSIILDDCISEFQKYLEKVIPNYFQDSKAQKNVFKDQVTTNVISSLLNLTNQSDFLKPYDKEITLTTLTKLYKIVQEIQENGKIQVFINQTIWNIERDTTRQLQDLQDLFQLLLSSKSCGKMILLKQFDQYVRKLQQQTYFWESLILLENQQIPKISRESLAKETDLVNKIELWKLILIQERNKTPSSKGTSLILEQQKIIQTQCLHQKTILKALQQYCGLGLQKNQLQSIQLFEELARSGNPLANAILGQLILEGQICEQNYEKAYEYFSESADQNCPIGIYFMSKLILVTILGKLYQEGKVQNKIFGEAQKSSSKFNNTNNSRIEECQFAISMLKIASEAGNVESMIYLGDLYSQGYKLDDFTLDSDYSTSEIYFKEASKQESVEAKFKLAKLYQKMFKISIYKNRIQFVHQLLLEAKNNEYLPAYYDMAKLLIEGIKDDLQPNQIMAELILEQGAMKGNSDCAKLILEIKYNNLVNNKINLQEFLQLLDSLDQVQNKVENLTFYYRGKIAQNGLQDESNSQFANQLFNLGSNLGCSKCKQELSLGAKKELNSKKEVVEQQEKQERFQASLGFVQQFKQTDWRSRFRKQSIFSNPFNISLIENDQSTIQARMTSSIIKTIEINDAENKRKRVISDYTGFTKQQPSDQSILLSNLKLNPNDQQQLNSNYQIQEQKSRKSSFYTKKEKPKFLRHLSQHAIHSQSSNLLNFQNT